MKKTATSKKAKKKSNLQAGFALALTFFAISIFLYFQSEYFGGASKGIVIVCIVAGFMGLGIELNNIASGKSKALTVYKKGTGIFDNIGVGFGILIVWFVLFRKYQVIWLNVLLSPLLLIGLFGFMQGVVNLIFTIVHEPQKQNKPDKNLSLVAAKKIILAISGVLGFVASLLQILQYFKIIP